MHVQGTNAHLVQESSLAPTAAAPASAGLWHSQRLMLLPRAFALVGRAVQRPPGSTVCEARLASPLLAQLWDHVVAGRVVFPAAAYAELALASMSSLLLPPAAAAAGLPGLAAAAIPAPLLLPTGPQLAAGQLPVVTCEVDWATGQLQVVSHAAGRAAVHMTCGAVCVLGGAPQVRGPRVSPGGAAALAAVCGRQPATAAQQLPSGAAAAAGMAALAPPAGCDEGAYCMHPASLDSALQLGAVGADAAAGPIRLRVPVGFELLVAAQASGSSGGGAARAQRAWAAACVVGGGERGLVLDYRLPSAHGLGGACVAGLVARDMAAADMRPAPLPEAAAERVPPADAGMLYQLAYVVAQPAAGEEPEEQAPGLVLSERLSQTSVAAASMAALQGLTAAQPAAIRLQGRNTAQLAGMLRSAALELPGIAFAATHASVFGTPAPDSSSLRAALSTAAAQAARANSGVYGDCLARSLRLLPQLLPSPAADLPAGDAFQLVAVPRGALSNMVPRQVSVQAGDLSAGQVAVKVKGVGVNFRWAALQLAQCSPPSFWRSECVPEAGLHASPIMLLTRAATMQGRAQRAGHVPG